MDIDSVLDARKVWYSTFGPESPIKTGDFGNFPQFLHEHCMTAIQVKQPVVSYLTMLPISILVS
jgi:hypothetical protein